MDEQDQSRPLHDALLAVLRRRRAIAMVYAGVIMTALAGIFLLPPQYRAAAKILLTTNQAQISTSAGGATELTRTNRVAQEELNSQLEILRSRELIQEVAQKVGATPNRALAEPIPALQWPSQIVQGPLAFLQASYRQLHDITHVEAANPLDVQVTKILRRLEVQPLGRSTVLEVAITDADPVWSRDFVNELAEAYVEQHSRFQQLSAAEDFFKKQSDILRQKLIASEAELQRMHEEAGALAGQQTEVQNRLNEFGAELAHTRTALAEQRGRVGYLERVQPKNHASGRVATPEILALEAMRAELLGRYRADSHRVQAVNKQIAALRAAVVSYDGAAGAAEAGIRAGRSDLLTARAELEALKSRAEATSRQVEEYRRQVEMLDTQSFDLARLERQVNLDEQAYLSYVRATEESRLSNAIEQSKILRLSIVESATIPTEPISPNKGRILSFALMGGLVFSIGVGIALEFLDTTIKTAEDIRRYASLDVLAVLPERALKGSGIGAVAR